MILNLGDSTFNTQIYASIEQLFSQKETTTVAAFTIFQFLQNIGSAVGFFYSPYLPVHGLNGSIYQLVILGGLEMFSALLFFSINFKKEVKPVIIENDQDL